MISGNRALRLTPWHPQGFGASEELIQRAARLIVCEYALPQNFKYKNLGCLSAPDEGSGEKKWIKGLPRSLLRDIEYRIKHQMIADELRSGKYCFGIAHADFTNLFVLDVDDPGLGDAKTVAKGLTDQGWHYKQFDSGKGRHFWVFFDDLPIGLLSRYQSGIRAMREVAKRLVHLLRDSLKSRVDIRGCGKALIKLPLQYDPHYHWIILPFDDGGTLITDYRDAVDFAAAIQRNDSSELIDWLESHPPRVRDKPNGAHQCSLPGSSSGFASYSKKEVTDWL